MIARRALALALWMPLSGLAAAQTDPGEAVRSALDRLDSPKLSEREAGEVALATAPGFRLADLERLLADETEFSPEQLLRIRQVGRRLFDARPLAGMGVQFGGFGPDGVVLQATIGGFPAADLLLPLDTIRSIDGVRIQTQDDMRWAILSRDPGEELLLEVLREERVLTVSVALGSFGDLPNAQRPTGMDLARAFSERWDRKVGNPLLRRDPIGAGITVDEWARVEAMGRDGVSPHEPWPLTRESGSRMIGFGGQARTSLAAHQALVEPAMLVDELSGSREHSSTVAEVVDRIRTLSRQRTVVDQRAQTLERHADGTANPDQRDQFRAMRNESLQELIRIDAQLEMMREVLRQLREDGR